MKPIITRQGSMRLLAKEIASTIAITYDEWVVLPNGDTWKITGIWEQCIFEHIILLFIIK